MENIQYISNSKIGTGKNVLFFQWIFLLAYYPVHDIGGMHMHYTGEEHTSICFQMKIVEPYIVVVQHLWQTGRHELEYQIETETVTEMIQQLYDLKNGKYFRVLFYCFILSTYCHVDGDLLFSRTLTGGGQTSTHNIIAFPRSSMFSIILFPYLPQIPIMN